MSQGKWSRKYTTKAVVLVAQALVLFVGTEAPKPVPLCCVTPGCRWYGAHGCWAPMVAVTITEPTIAVMQTQPPV